MTNYLIFGASRGLGALFSRELPKAGDTVWVVSRSEPFLDEADGVERIWIPADLSMRGTGTLIAQKYGDEPLDVCLYNAGIWEEDAFSEQYDYEKVNDEETERIIAINLTSAIISVQKLLPNLRRSKNAKIIFTGSVNGLDNSRQPEVAYNASKFGLRGVTHALREVVRKDRISVTCVNLGSAAATKDEMEADANARSMVSPDDLIAVMRCIISLSNASCVKEIDLLAMADGV
jgi:NAD(P)-dependent dehydrogenase (short-subunit alcohol dehydrogenase family)